MKSWLERAIIRVENGTSETFNNWHSFTGISKDRYIAALEWLAADPMVIVNGKERLSREVGCKKDGTLIYGKRAYYDNGDFNGIFPVDKNLTRLSFPKVSINKFDKV